MQAAYDISMASSPNTSKRSEETKAHLRLQFPAEPGSWRPAHLQKTDKSLRYQALGVSPLSPGMLSLWFTGVLVGPSSSEVLTKPNTGRVGDFILLK